ncbi:MAG: flagellar motor switch protein FliM [Porcipelethomonas sp.]
MPDVLSQSQIDELLKNLGSADEKTLENMTDNLNEKQVKVYDFKAPKKFTKEQFKTIRNIYESYSKTLSSYLTSLTRFYCRVEVLQIEEQHYYEFNNALPDYTVMGNIDLIFDEDSDMLDTKCMIQFSNAVSFSLIDRLLGGYGKSIDVSRNFTDIEISVMKGVIEKMGTYLRDVFAPYVDVQPLLTNIETNARVNQTIGADEVIILATLEVEYNDVKNIVTITVPALSMEAIISKDNKDYNVDSNRSRKEAMHREGIIKQISRSNFKIEAVLADTTVNLSEILSLHRGDVLLLNAPIDRNVSLMVNNEKLFDGKMGIINHRKAVKICNVYNVRR